MFRILAAIIAALTLAGAAHACPGQVGRVLLDDHFSSAGKEWDYSASFTPEADGATLTVKPDSARSWDLVITKHSFPVLGDFCIDLEFPPEASAGNAKIGLVLLSAPDFAPLIGEDFYAVTVDRTGRVSVIRVDAGAKHDRATDRDVTTLWEAEDLTFRAGTQRHSIRVIAGKLGLDILVDSNEIATLPFFYPKGLSTAFVGAFVAGDRGASAGSRFKLHAIMVTAGP